MALRIFLVDDLAPLQACLQDLFAVVGGLQLVARADNEGAAGTWLDGNREDWDVAVLDLVLESGSGFGVITRCRQSKPQGRVVVFSSHATPTVRAHCLALGADAVFGKQDPEAFVAWLLHEALTAPPAAP